MAEVVFELMGPRVDLGRGLLPGDAEDEDADDDVVEGAAAAAPLFALEAGTVFKFPLPTELYLRTGRESVEDVFALFTGPREMLAMGTKTPELGAHLKYDTLHACLLETCFGKPRRSLPFD
jgi:hypothetical protein